MSETRFNLIAKDSFYVNSPLIYPKSLSSYKRINSVI
jgi:hypothetical protein